MRRYCILVLTAFIIAGFTPLAWAMPAKIMTDSSIDLEIGYVGATGISTKASNGAAVSNFSGKPGFDASIALGQKAGFGYVGYCGATAAQFSVTNTNVNFSFSDFSLDAVWTDDKVIGGGLSWGVGVLARAMPISWQNFDSATTTNVVGLQLLAGYNGRKPGELFGLYAGIDAGYGYSFTSGVDNLNTTAFTYDAEAGITIGLTNALELNGGVTLKGMGFPSESFDNFAIYGYRVGLGYKM